jgi:hypothetical protein
MTVYVIEMSPHDLFVHVKNLEACGQLADNMLAVALYREVSRLRLALIKISTVDGEHRTIALDALADGGVI